MKETTFMLACKSYFGLKLEQTTAEFGAEVKGLTDKDRADLCAMFPSVGYTIKDAK